MQANRKTSQKRREFLSRTGVLAVTALPIGAGFTPRVLLAEGCGVAKLGLVAGATMTTIGMASKSIPGRS